MEEVDERSEVSEKERRRSPLEEAGSEARKKQEAGGEGKGRTGSLWVMSRLAMV